MNRNNNNLLLQFKYHFIKSGQTSLYHNKKIINIILIINILQNQNQQCNKKVFNPSLSRREREKDSEGLGDEEGEEEGNIQK